MRFTTLLAPLFLVSLVTAPAASLYDIALKDIDGQPATLAPFKGKAMLIVNVASKCGFTPQYKELEALAETYKDRGLVVLGFPCNQFGGQEPGTNAEIKEFCSLTYGVKFPLYDKLEVNGPQRHPLYDLLTGDTSPFPGKIGWNFTKFLIGRDGRILHRFDSKVKPGSPEVIAAVEAALTGK